LSRRPPRAFPQILLCPDLIIRLYDFTILRVEPRFGVSFLPVDDLIAVSKEGHNCNAHLRRSSCPVAMFSKTSLHAELPM